MPDQSMSGTTIVLVAAMNTSASLLMNSINSHNMSGMGYDEVAKHAPANEFLEIIHEFCMPFLALLTFLLRLMCIAVFSMPIKLSPAATSTNHSAVQSSSSSYHHNHHYNQWSGAGAGTETSDLLSHNGNNNNNNNNNNSSNNQHPQHQQSRSSRTSHQPAVRTSSFVVINRYLRVNCIFEAFISFTYILLPFFVFCRTFTCHKTYLYKWLYVYIIGYGSNFSSMVSIAANCFLCFYRYLVIFNKRYRFLDVVTRSSNMFIVGLIFACAVINLPFLFAHKITNNNRSDDLTATRFRLASGDVLQSSIGQKLVDLTVLIRLLLIFIFLGLNLVLLFSSVRFARRKRNLLGTSNRWRRTVTTSRPSSILITNLEREPSHDTAGENETIASSPEHNQQSHQTSLMVLSIPETASIERKSSSSFVMYSSKSSISNFEVTFKLSSSSQHPASPPHDQIHSQPQSSKSEWNLTKMTLLIAFIYLLNILSLGLAFVYERFNQENYDGVVAIDLIASNFIQVTSLFEIVSYFLFNKCFSRNFKILMRKFVNFLFRK